MRNRDAILSQSKGIILIHSHPSGSLKTSLSDLSLTDKIKKATMIMDIKLLDHLIITEDGFYSLADEGRL